VQDKATSNFEDAKKKLTWRRVDKTTDCLDNGKAELAICRGLAMQKSESGRSEGNKSRRSAIIGIRYPELPVNELQRKWRIFVKERVAIDTCKMVTKAKL
jgi:hypothetical protein